MLCCVVKKKLRKHYCYNFTDFYDNGFDVMRAILVCLYFFLDLSKKEDGHQELSDGLVHLLFINCPGKFLLSLCPLFCPYCTVSQFYASPKVRSA